MDAGQNRVMFFSPGPPRQPQQGWKFWISQPEFLLLVRLLMRAAALLGARLGLRIQHLIK